MMLKVMTAAISPPHPIATLRPAWLVGGGQLTGAAYQRQRDW